MSKRKNIEKSDILLFKEKNGNLSQLKTFINFLKWEGVKAPIRFSFVESGAALLPNLTLKENILLDSIPISIINNDSFKIEDYLLKNGNHYIYEMYNSIEFVDEYPDQVTTQEKKIAALIKGILKKSEYLILERPEMYLSKENLELFTRALNYDKIQNKRTVMIKSDRNSYWVAYATKLISRTQNNDFIVRPMPQKNHDEFHHIDSIDEGHLVFNNVFTKNKISA